MAEQVLVEAVFEVLSDVYPTSPWTKEQIAADMDQPQTGYYFVEVAEEIVGFLAIQDLAGELEITNIAVKKNYQGQGLAGKLLDNLEDRPGPIFLEVRENNLPARALYEKYGFEQIGLRKNYYHEPLENAVIMERRNDR
ncbi:ribosomal protein S18-alanine N-acetyltransferase [Streptococcus gallolyticus]|uniref:ribosomal protein S18-alanine N-acetyltransferase n=1 Tax=Streptococcus hepaticus TaxID=3349163 RepID=UPI001C939670|nr:ribosomal protein S18-alanine N-acetyltransferase [Streptococcus gallolyticus]MBY5040871.1 ribosomal protein S18-alanine N-acetyltransferase [Streptococcus gallolyticus]